MTILELTEGWTLELARAGAGPPAGLEGRHLPATVPGCVHTDLMAAGVIADPLLESNETQVQWIGRCDWRYRCRVAVPADLAGRPRIDLHCEGLDTVATVELNGAVVGRTANMHRPYRFAVQDLLHPGENELVVTFTSALSYAAAQAERLGERPRAYPLPYNFVRKMACNFGWDWGPTLVTAGIWRPMRLEGWSLARIAGLRPQLRLTDAGTPHAGTPHAPAAGRVETQLLLERAGERAPLAVSLRLHGPEGGAPPRAGRSRGPEPVELETTVTVPPDEDAVLLHMDVPAVARWWPRGYGDQPLYRLELEVQDARGELLDRRRLRSGFREVALDTRPDEAGAAFTLVVNGRPVFAKGADWIPDDPFPSRLPPGRLRRRLQQAADAHMNALRVWGGGIYESEAFYDACDELGLLVWQDFAFACAAYPEEEPFASEVEAEARAAIARLAHHPSLALWNGNNENLWGFEDWGWKAELKGRSWGKGYYLELLPRLVAELDPSRPYWPGSPWSGEGMHPNADGAGCKHIWDAWNEKDYTVYRDYRPRFVAEFGHQAPPAFATLRRALGDAPLAPDAPGMLHHQKAVDGNAKLEARLAEHFPVPEAFDSWHFATQLNQARALDLGIRHFRSLAPHCMGTLVWQLNDCWPATSWAAVDVDGRPKPLWFALRRAFAPRLLTLEPRPEGLRLVLHNDADTPWHARVHLRRVRLDGSERAARTFALEVEPRGAATGVLLPDDLTVPEDAEGELLVADSDGQRCVHGFVPDRRLRYPEPRITARLERTGSVHTLSVTASTLVRDLTLLPDRLHPLAVADEALVTLLPGESQRFTVRSPVPLARAALSSPPVLMSANHVVRAAARG